MIRSFSIVLRFEIAKAIRSRLTWVTIILPALLAGLTIWGGASAEKIEAAVDGMSLEPPSAFLYFARGMGNGLTIGSILLLFYASMMLAQEGHWRTFKVIMLRPHRRVVWIASKFALLLMVAAGVLIAVLCSALVSASLAGDFAAILEEGYEHDSRANMIRYSLIALALTLPSILAVGAFGMMFSSLTDHTGLATGSCLGTYLMLEIVKGSVDETRQVFMFNTFMPSLIDTSYFQVLRGYAEGMSDTYWEAPMIYYSVATPLVSAVVFLGVATMIFSRRNFL